MTKPKTPVEKMKQIAEEAHQGQYRRDGVTPYITHLSAVADMVEPRLKPIAWGHDLIEDTNVTIEDLKKEGIDGYIIAAISTLTHKPGDSNMVYWQKILTNPDAVLVKIADINHNLSQNPSESAKKKYARALVLFSKYEYSV